MRAGATIESDRPSCASNQATRRSTTRRDDWIARRDRCHDVGLPRLEPSRTAGDLGGSALYPAEVHKLLAGHATFRREFVAGSKEFLERLASAHQSPAAMLIGCADSRVVPELLTSSAPGDLFVIRNVANLVPHAEHGSRSVGSALEYALGALHVRHVVVCGHYGCGGVKAMIDGVDRQAMPNLAQWIEQAAAQNAVAHEEGVADREAQWQRAVEENVLDQIAHLTGYPCARPLLESGELTIHGWVYDLRGDLFVYDDDRAAFVHNT